MPSTPLPPAARNTWKVCVQCVDFLWMRFVKACHGFLTQSSQQCMVGKTSRFTHTLHTFFTQVFTRIIRLFTEALSNFPTQSTKLITITTT